MNNINQIHKTLLIVALFSIAAQIFVYFYLLKPVAKKEHKAQLDLKAAQSLIKRNNWPTDIKQLQQIKSDFDEKLNGDESDEKSIAQLTTEAIQKTNTTFAASIKSKYGNSAEFMRNASLIDYQEEHNRVFATLSKRGFILNPQDIGLAENESSPYVYQLMLHLWTVEKILTLAADNGLILYTQQAPKQQQNKREKSRDTTTQNQAQLPLHILPMKAYVNDGQTSPYLLEFPVQIHLQGKLSSFQNFLSKSQENDCFIPVSSFEIFAISPQKIEAAPDGLIAADQMHFNLVCSAFLYIANK